MEGYFIHLTGNTLKLALYSNDQPVTLLTEELLPTIAARSMITDPQEFVKDLSRMLMQNLGTTLPKLPLYFLLEPELTEIFLLTIDKTDPNGSNQFQHQISAKLVDETLDNLYYTTYKIAPFIYQFLGIKKSSLQTYFEVASKIGLEIGGIVPLGLVLPKTNTDISSMFVFPYPNYTTVVFCELTGTLFAEKLTKKIPLHELKELYWTLSVYNSKKNDVNVYTTVENDHSFGSQKVNLIGNGELVKDYEELSLTKTTLDKNPSLLTTQSNLLFLQPKLPAETKKPFPTLAITSILSLLLVTGLIFQLTVGFSSILGNRPAHQGDKEVLANQNQTTKEPPQSQPVAAPQPKKEVLRSDLKLRVENGNGIAGSAGKLKTYLENLGYSVTAVGNSSKADYAKTTISLPKAFADYAELLTTDLKKNYVVELTNTETKAADYDVLIIAGLN